VEQAEIDRMAAELERLLAEKLGCESGTLSHRLAKAGRRLPARMRARGRVVAEAAALAGHPKLALRVDGARVAKAHAEVAAHLKAIDPGHRRRGLALSVAATVVFNLLIFAVLLGLAIRFLAP